MEGFSSMSRSGVTHTEGKLIRRLDVPVSEELEEAVIALAAMLGVPKAEFVRNVLERNVWGELAMLRRMTRAYQGHPADENLSNLG